MALISIRSKISADTDRVAASFHNISLHRNEPNDALRVSACGSFRRRIKVGNFAAILGAVLLFAGIALIMLIGDRRSLPWAPFAGVGLAVLGLGIEVAGAVAISS